ncbi:ABC transporter permease [Telmatospirillum siberiense]|uniref:Taurine ABC transporter permease n=1 Tax=Telmatospirillum siberiense TaxID=382514 RepID=A0A2N3PMS4_9PROT|nr:ABC transporter permease subunit [Telmatospirillum siberiense]PKU21683.1 taurine ABC transporter permease [Telmatospirillum siberiense]
MSTASVARSARLGPLISIASVAAFVLLWYEAARLGWASSLILPAPGEVLDTALQMLNDGYRHVPLWQHVAISLGRALAAFAAALVVGIPLGLAMGLSPILSSILDPFVQFLRPLPKLALIPLVIVWLGIGESSKIFLIFVSTLFSVIVGAAAAAGSVKVGRLRLARAFGATRRQQLWYFVLPSALPEIFTSVRLAFGVGWTTLIAAEMVAADSGMGWMVINASSYMRTDIVMLGILLLGVTGYLLDLAVVGLQRAVVPWAGRE